MTAVLSPPDTCRCPTAATDEQREVVVPTLRAAEELLDRLEACGLADRQVEPAVQGGFVVRWR